MSRRLARPGVLIPALFLVILASAGMYWKVKVLDERPTHSIEDFLQTFRTSSGPEALLGSYGQKRTQVRPHRYDRHGNPVWHGVGNIELTSMRVQRSDSMRIRAKLQTFESLLNVLASSRLGVRDEYLLAIRQIEELSRLVQAISDSVHVDPRLAEMLGDPDARIVTGVAEISDATTSDSDDHQVDVAPKLPDNDTLRVDIQIVRTNQRAIRNNTVVAYELGRLCWRGNTLVRIQKDIDGISDDCPQGLHGRRGL